MMFVRAIQGLVMTESDLRLLEIVLMLMAVYGSWANRLLGTAVVSPTLWLWLIPLGLAMFVFEEIRKWFVRRSFRARAVMEACRG